MHRHPPSIYRQHVPVAAAHTGCLQYINPFQPCAVIGWTLFFYHAVRRVPREGENSEESSMHTSLFGGQYIWKHHQLVVPSPLQLVSDLSSNLQLRAALLGVHEICLEFYWESCGNAA